MVASETLTCVLDPSVLNDETLPQMHDIGLSFFASLCGRNRGAFVLNPSDGHTWGCTSLPPNFSALAGANNTDQPLKDVNAIKDAYIAGNLTATDTIKVLDYFLKAVYWSSASVENDPYACNLDGLATLQCEHIVNAIPTLRSVTLAGLFTPALWATKGRHLTIDQMTSFYTARDFAEMKELGLNTVQVPFPMHAFVPDHDVSRQDADDSFFIRKHLSRILDWVDDNGLQAILLLVGPDYDDAVTAAAHYAADHPAVFALTVPSIQSMKTARAAESMLKLMVSMDESSLTKMSLPEIELDTNVFASLSWPHINTVADVASSTSLDDRMKLFYHEATACIGRSLTEYSACVHHVPVFVQAGFDLSIDDCVFQHMVSHKEDTDGVSSFVDYGQCDRFDETLDSPWWERHRQSLAARQLFSYEHGLGWSFTAWKLYNETHVGVIDKPSKLMSLKDVAKAGLFPSLHQTLPKMNSTAMAPAQFACLNPPVDDFMMGDKTYAPSPSPPPDCGNGWWNATTSVCDYWIPPITTPPTMAPTCGVCPDLVAPVPCPVVLPSALGMNSTSSSSTELLMAAGVGAVMAILVSFITTKCFGRRSQYSTIPELTV